MQKKDKVLVGCLLGILLLLALAGIFFVHRKEKKEEKEEKVFGGQMIRVIISTSDFSDIFHEQVQLTAKEGCRIFWEDGEDTLKQGEVWSADQFFAAHRATPLCRFLPEDGNTVTLQTVSRGYGQPEYEGCPGSER